MSYGLIMSLHPRYDNVLVQDGAYTHAIHVIDMGCVIDGIDALASDVIACGAVDAVVVPCCVLCRDAETRDSWLAFIQLSSSGTFSGVVAPATGIRE